jgi:hypothetical protein
VRRPDVNIVLQVVGAVVELAVFAMLVWRMRRAAAQLQSATGDDLLLGIGALTDPVLRGAAAGVVVFYYAFMGPRVRRQVRPGEFSYIESSGLASLLLGLALLLAMEGVGAHLLLRAWSPRAAWVHAAANVYALVWLAALFQAALRDRS